MEVMPRPVSRPQVSACISLSIHTQSFQMHCPYATAQLQFDVSSHHILLHIE